MSILERIYASALKFLVPLNLDETYKVIVEEAIKLTDGQYGTIYLASGDELNRVFSTMPGPHITLRKRGYRYKAFKEQKSILVHRKDLKKLKIIHPELQQLEAQSVLIVPLVNEGKSAGLLTIDSYKDKRFNDEDLHALKLFGSLASMAIRKAQLYGELKESLDTRDLFISLASHELRTPLTTINGYVQLLLVKVRERKPIDNKWILELAFESERMKNLLDEFLEINRIKIGKMQFNFGEISLSEILNHAISTFKFNFPKRKLIIKNSLPKKDFIIGDADKLHQVFMNILENGVKYSRPNTLIIVSTAKQRDFFRVVFSDQGWGIEEKDLPQVFKGFFKGKNSKHEGMGLGLYLARNIINAHKGEIGIKSKVDRGTSVVIKLPKI